MFFHTMILTIGLSVAMVAVLGTIGGMTRRDAFWV